MDLVGATTLHHYENSAITGILRDMPYPAFPTSGALDDAHSFISGLNSTSV